MDELDEAIQSWTERLFLAKEVLANDPSTSVSWSREVVDQIEGELRRTPEELPRLRSALLRAREALTEAELECKLFQREAKQRNQSFHAHETTHQQLPRMPR